MPAARSEHAHGPSPRREGDHPQQHRHAHGHLTWALLLTLGYALVEAGAGYWSGSLALISDAGHMLTDATALGLAAGAAWLARRPPSARHTYGLARAEVLAALVNGLLMLALIGYLTVESLDRLAQPRPIHGGVVTTVAALGLLVNLAIAWRLAQGGQDLNTRAALLHVVGDLLGSVAAITAGVVILLTGWTPIDPLLSLLVAGLILLSAWRLLAEVLQVLLEGVPRHIRLEAVGRDLAALDGVRAVHDLHVWTLASGRVALSAHLELADLAGWPRILLQARHLLATRHGIGHVTLQPEAGDNPVLTPIHNPHRRS